jgi:predicted RNA-binding protein with TRAM domain
MMNRSVPVSVGQELNVKIEAVGEKGDGIAKEQGFVLFVPGVKQGDNVKIRVTKVLQKVGFAEVIGSASSDSGEESSQESSNEEPEEEKMEETPEDSEDFGEDEEEQN